jgi:hypothetical protein
MTAPTVEPAGVSESVRPTVPTLVDGRYQWTDRHGITLRMNYEDAVHAYNRDDRDALLGITDALHQQLAELQRELATSGREFQAMFKEAVSYKQQLAEMRVRVDNLYHAVDSKQAKIDALMLEFCPGEMSAEQKAEWARNQVAGDPLAPTSADPVRSAGEAVPERGKCDAYIPGHNSSRCVLPSGHRGDCSDTSSDCVQPERHDTYADIAADLASRQVDLPADFKRVLYGNRRSLYIRAEPADCAQPERQGAEQILKTLDNIMRSDWRLSTGFEYARRIYVADLQRVIDYVKAITTSPKPSPPPTDDIVTFLRELNRAVFNSKSTMLDRAIAALGEKGKA